MPLPRLPVLPSPPLLIIHCDTYVLEHTFSFKPAFPLIADSIPVAACTLRISTRTVDICMQCDFMQIGFTLRMPSPLHLPYALA